MAANNVEKRRRDGSSPHLLTGLIFDGVGNRMSPVHTLKKGVRYRYYVSQAVAQCRKEEAGAIARVPAPDVEAMVSGLIATRFGVPGVVPGWEVLEAHVYKVTVQAEALEIALQAARKPANKDFGPSQPPLKPSACHGPVSPLRPRRVWSMSRSTSRPPTLSPGTPPWQLSAKPGSGSRKSWPAAPSPKSPNGKAGASVRSGF